LEGLQALAQEASRPAPCGEPPAEAAPAEPAASADAGALVACPYLGLAEDPDTRFSVPDQEHICRGTRRQSYIPDLQQRAYCLNAQYLTCAVFLAMQQGRQVAPPWGRERGGAKKLLERVLRRR